MEPQHAHDAPLEVALPDTTTVPIVEGHGLRLVEPPPQHFLQGEDVPLINPEEEGNGLGKKLKRLMQTKIF